MSKQSRTISSRVRRRRLAALGIGVLVAGVAAWWLVRDGDGDGTGAGAPSATPDPGVGRLIPGDLPEGFRVLEFRDLSEPSPFPQIEVGLRAYGAAEGDDPFGAGDLGILAVRSPGSQGARSFALGEPEEVEIGDITAYRSEFPFGEEPLRVLAWDLATGDDPEGEPTGAGGDGVVVLVGTRTLDSDQVDALVPAVDLRPGGDEVPSVAGDALPDGFREVTAGNASFLLTGSPPAGLPGYEIQYIGETDPSRRITLSRWRAEVEWQPMLRWWLGSEGRTVRFGGRPVSVAPLRNGETDSAPTFLLSWRDGDVATILTTTGLTEEAVIDLAESVREAKDDEWAEVTNADGSVPLPPSAPAPEP